jgi:hypothetical protein
MRPGIARRRAPAPVASLLVSALVALSVVAASPAHAAPARPPAPETPSFRAAIEPASEYEPGAVCDPVNRPGAKKLAGLIRATYGAGETIGIARDACYTTSEHNDGRALDWMNSASNAKDRAQVRSFIDWALAADKHGHEFAMARRLGIMYMIWNKRIWRSYAPGWEAYTGPVPHTDHIHISLNLDGASGRTSFWTGRPLAGPCAVGTLTEAAPAVVTDPMNFVPVAATQVLSTKRGVGTLNGPCRLFAPPEYGSRPSRVDAQVAGVGAVPSTGVAAVALQVAMRRPTATSSLTAGPAGRALPSVARVSTQMNQSATSTLVLPVGADGKVSFATSAAATDLVVSVVGFFLDPSLPPAVRRAIAAGGGDRFHALPARRVLSGSDGAIGAGSRRKLVLAGTEGVDAAASAAVVTVTTRPGSGRGSVFVYAAGAGRPSQPLVEYRSKTQTVQTTVPLGRDGAVVVENAGRRARTVDVDLVGTYEPQAGGGGLGFAPRRSPKGVVSTRSDLGIKRLNAGVEKDFSVADATRQDTRAVLLQVTVRNPSADTELVFWRPDRAKPSTVDVSGISGRAVATTIVAPVDSNGMVRLMASAGSNLDVKIAVVGSFR